MEFQKESINGTTGERIVITTINSTPIYRIITPYLPANAQLRKRAIALRKMGNLPEIIFWKQVHKGKFHNIDFDRQRIIGNFIVDFYVKSLGLVVEIDGSSHDNKKLYDAKREEYLRNLGLKIYRISTIRIKRDTNNILKELEEFIIQNYG